MLRYREIIELRSIGLSLEKVSFLCGCSIDKVKKIAARASVLGLEWPVPIEFSEDELQRLLDPQANSLRYQPDCKVIFDKLKEGGHSEKLTKKHIEAAWAAYLGMAEKEGVPPYANNRFQDIYTKWHKRQSYSPNMRVNWTPAEEIQVDWAGSTLTLYGKNGDQTSAYLFVATSPYSDYTFVRASLDMSMQSWLEHHRHMFEFFGGVPLFLTPDNLSTGVTIDKKKPYKDRQRIHINPKYQELADHYGVIVMPARAQAPRDKGAVEMHVKVAAGRIISTLSHFRFTSIDQLNYAINELLNIFNDRLMYDFKASRMEIFQEEKPFFAPLPDKPFTSVTWLKCKAASDAVVRVRGVYYGIPQNYGGQKVIARISDDCVDIFTSNRKQMLAHHVRRPDGSETFEGFAGRRPDRFKPLSEWATQNNRQAMLDQWHPAKNEGLTPHDVVCHSKKQVWWHCAECGHEWQETPFARTRRNWDDCLACANVDLVPGRNDLATLFPNIAAEWHPMKNGCEPSEVFPDYHMLAWWVGSDCGHEWRASVAQRTSSKLGQLCPHCSGKEALPGFNDVATLCPELAELWHPTKNRERRPEHTSICSISKVYLWHGALSDIWMESPRSWMIRNGYDALLEPFEQSINEAKMADKIFCATQAPASVLDESKTTLKWNRYVNQWAKDMSLEQWCLNFARPELLHEWHPDKNGNLTPSDIYRGSFQRVWWKCEHGHEWQAKVIDRTQHNLSCSVCTRRKRVHAGANDLASCKPDLLKWYSPKNNILAPDQISDRFWRQVWWKCPHCGAEWTKAIKEIPSDTMLCPACGRERKGIRRSFIRGINDLAIKKPTLAAEWHPTKNGDLKPEDVLSKSSKKVWWKCKCGHEWKASVANRAYGEGCPYCSNKKVLPGYNDLATTHPQLAAEWHPTKNGDLQPNSVTAGSKKKVWWLCEKGHEWEASVTNRARDRGCPYCSNKKVLPGYNDLATTHPQLAAEWHPTKNGDLQPNSVTAGSKKKVWWRCVRGHEWNVPVTSRATQGKGCPVCSNRIVVLGYNDLASQCPNIAARWHPTKNGELTPSDVAAGAGKKVWWLGECGHEWQASIVGYTHIQKITCPYCANVRVLQGFNDLATTHPQIAAQWHPNMNVNLAPKDVTAGSNKRVWWVCSAGHVWKEMVKNRAKFNFKCPYCSGRKVPERPTKLGRPSDIPTQQRIGINLEQWCKNNHRPNLLEEWHIEKNGDLTPKDILAKSKKHVWWKCKHGHEWQENPDVRTRGKNGINCPFCANRRVAAGFNDLSTVHPQLAAEWHPTKNGELTPADVVAGSGKKVWWICAECKHEWEARIVDRRKRQGCPNCWKGKRKKNQN